MNRECAQGGVDFRWGRGLTHCLAATIVDENELRIPTLDQSEFLSGTTGDILSGAWGEHMLRFHYFNFPDTRVTDQQ